MEQRFQRTGGTGNIPVLVRFSFFGHEHDRFASAAQRLGKRCEPESGVQARLETLFLTRFRPAFRTEMCIAGEKTSYSASFFKAHVSWAFMVLAVVITNFRKRPADVVPSAHK